MSSRYTKHVEINYKESPGTPMTMDDIIDCNLTSDRMLVIYYTYEKQSRVLHIPLENIMWYKTWETKNDGTLY